MKKNRFLTLASFAMLALSVAPLTASANCYDGCVGATDSGGAIQSWDYCYSSVCGRTYGCYNYCLSDASFGQKSADYCQQACGGCN